MTKKSKLFIECDQKDKAIWVQAARASSSSGKLEDWVTQVLNEAAANADIPPPAWMPFSKHTCAALRLARITKPEELVAVVEEDALWNIESLDPDQVKEIEDWYRDK